MAFDLDSENRKITEEIIKKAKEDVASSAADVYEVPDSGLDTTEDPQLNIRKVTNEEFEEILNKINPNSDKEMETPIPTSTPSPLEDSRPSHLFKPTESGLGDSKSPTPTATELPKHTNVTRLDLKFEPTPPAIERFHSPDTRNKDVLGLLKVLEELKGSIEDTNQLLQVLIGEEGESLSVSTVVELLKRTLESNRLLRQKNTSIEAEISRLFDSATQAVNEAKQVSIDFKNRLHSATNKTQF